MRNVKAKKRAKKATLSIDDAARRLADAILDVIEAHVPGEGAPRRRARSTGRRRTRG